MPIKKYKPTSPGRRQMAVLNFDELTADKPERSLLAPIRKKAGRNNMGRISVRHRGGGQKRFYRVIDFKRNKDGVPAKVATLEYDPNRSANIALVHYADGEKRYILAPLGLSVGDTVISGTEVDIKPGNTLPVRNIPTGTLLHNIELQPRAWRPDGALGRRFRPTDGQGGGLRSHPDAIGRGAAGPLELPGDHRSDRQPGS